MSAFDNKVVLGAGTIVVAIGASLCCILPVAAVLLGVGSAALGVQLEPFRPYFLGLTVLFLGTAFYQVYKPIGQECGPEESCAVPASRSQQRMIVWAVAIVALALAAFPYYLNWII